MSQLSATTAVATPAPQSSLSPKAKTILTTTAAGAVAGRVLGGDNTKSYITGALLGASAGLVSNIISNNAATAAANPTIANNNQSATTSQANTGAVNQLTALNDEIKSLNDKIKVADKSGDMESVRELSKQRNQLVFTSKNIAQNLGFLPRTASQQVVQGQGNGVPQAQAGTSSVVSDTVKAAALGAVAGQVAGGDTESTVKGAAAGGLFSVIKNTFFS